MPLSKPITICVDGQCWSGTTIFGGHPRWWGFAKVPGEVVEEKTGNYTNLFLDASIVGGIHEVTKGISDSGTRAALESGLAAAVKAMEKRGGEGRVKITLGE